MGRRYKPVLLLSLFLLLIALAPHDASAQGITPQQWQQLKGDKAFNYKNEREEALKRKDYQAGPLQKFFQSFFSFFSGGFATLLVWLIVFLVAAYVIYRLTLSSDSILFQKEKKRSSNVNGDAIAEDFATADWDQIMQQALSNNDTRLAIRSAYMRLLQLLQQKQLISCRQDKTNHEYYNELMQTPYQQPFRQMSRLYEYAWYGKYPVSPASLSDYLSLLNTVKNELRR